MGSYSYLHSGLPRTYAPEMHNSLLCMCARARANVHIHVRVAFAEARKKRGKGEIKFE